MKKAIVLLLGLTVFISCNKEKKETAELVNNSDKTVMKTDSEGYDLFKMRCYACHNPKAKSHDEIIAPPMAAVKRRYFMSYKTKDDFVNAVTKWALNPEEGRALMRGAVMRFKVMPKQAFKEDELRKIAGYIYDNEIEQPEWFAAHEKEMHEKMGKGMGRGMGKGMMKNN
ncbi:MAG: hypothetical protein DSY82_00785 [Flavobacteriia bacterium]|nr:MAG: hypothetical protein DSY82_00785 [Flavobacteriia bacterium]